MRGCDGVERDYAEIFANFIYENQQELISRFGVGEYGRPSLYPAKDEEPALQELWSVLASEYG